MLRVAVGGVQRHQVPTAPASGAGVGIWPRWGIFVLRSLLHGEMNDGQGLTLELIPLSVAVALRFRMRDLL
jgi:hypothetical protein